MKTFHVGTRGSALALSQTAQVLARLADAFATARFQPLVVRTTGDIQADLPLAAVGTEGVFVKELQRALERGECDFAVHSLKDLPTASPEGLAVGAVLPRADARDALIARRAQSLGDLPDGAVIGTGSLRRRAQLAALNPSWRCRDIRGNLETRLAKLDAGLYDALILASAGLDRLGHGARITQRLPYSAMLPAPGQGAIAVEIRRSDAEAVAMAGTLDDAPTRAAVEAERALLGELEGGCQVPVGAHGEVVGEHLVLEGELASLDGRQIVRRRMEGPALEPAALGVALAREILAQGGRAILAELRAMPRASGEAP